MKFCILSLTLSLSLSFFSDAFLHKKYDYTNNHKNNKRKAAHDILNEYADDEFTRFDQSRKFRRVRIESGMDTRALFDDTREQINMKEPSLFYMTYLFEITKVLQFLENKEVSVVHKLNFVQTNLDEIQTGSILAGGLMDQWNDENDINVW